MLPGLCFGLHALCNHLGGVLGCEHSCQAKVEDIGDVVDKAVASALMREGLGGVTELGTMAKGIHSFEHEAADNDPQGWANAAALAGAMGGMEGGARVASGGDAVGHLNKVVGMEQDSGCHEASSSRDALATAEEHGKIDNDAAKTWRHIHVK